MRPPLSLTPSAGPSDSAIVLANICEELVNSVKRVSDWVEAPGENDLKQIAIEIQSRFNELQAAISAELETGRPSSAQMEWKCRAASDKTTRAWTTFDQSGEWGSDEWNAAKVEHERAYQEYLQLDRERRAHPDWKPKFPKKPRLAAAAKKRSKEIK